MGSYIYEADLYSRIIVRDGNLDKVDEINFEREIYFFRQHGDYMFIGSNHLLYGPDLRKYKAETFALETTRALDMPYSFSTVANNKLLVITSKGTPAYYSLEALDTEDLQTIDDIPLSTYTGADVNYYNPVRYISETDSFLIFAIAIASNNVYYILDKTTLDLVDTVTAGRTEWVAFSDSHYFKYQESALPLNGHLYRYTFAGGSAGYIGGLPQTSGTAFRLGDRLYIFTANGDAIVDIPSFTLVGVYEHSDVFVRRLLPAIVHDNSFLYIMGWSEIVKATYDLTKVIISPVEASSRVAIGIHTKKPELGGNTFFGFNF